MPKSEGHGSYFGLNIPVRVKEKKKKIGTILQVGLELRYPVIILIFFDVKLSSSRPNVEPYHATPPSPSHPFHKSKFPNHPWICYVEVLCLKLGLYHIRLFST